MSPVRVVIADDHPTFVRAVELLFERDPDVEVVGSAASGIDAVRQAIELQPDVVLMDVNMPHMNGIEAVAEITRDAPHVAVVMLTMYDDDANVLEALRRGARGYLLKGARRDEIRRAIDAACAGEAVLGAGVARRLPSIVAPEPLHDRNALFPALTPRELDVLQELARGLDNRGIASALGLSEKTVRNYISGILTKVQVTTRTEAALLARDAGLV